MWEFSMFAKKNCYFKHSAVWVSLFQLVFLRFPHPLNFHMQLKKTPSNWPNVLGSRIESRLGCCREDMGSTGWQWNWFLTVWLWGSGTRQPHGARPPSPGFLFAAADPRLSPPLRQAHGWLPSDGGAQRPRPPLPGAWDGCRCLLVPTHGPEDIRSSELIHC